MADTAIVEYFVSLSSTLVFLTKRGFEKPLVYEIPVTKDYLSKCTGRLIIDFHGLPMGWDNETSRFEHYKMLLSMNPSVNSLKRLQGIRQQNLKNSRFRYELTYLEELSEILFPEELKEQIAKCALLYIIPYGPLHSIPFAALRWSDNEYLIERFGICYGHSTGVLRYCQNKNRKRTHGIEHRPKSLLIAAVAAANDLKPQYFEEDGNILAGVFLEQNIHNKVTSLIGTTAAEGRKPASKELITEFIQEHDIIHLACHGIFGLDEIEGDSLNSGLMVSDGHNSLSTEQVKSLTKEERAPYMLMARDIFNLKLSADLVTLRACSSGRTEIKSGDELIGLTRAFFYAGTPSVIASLWNVNQNSSQQLLNEFYRLWLDNNKPLYKWQALRQAQINMIKTEDYAHPYHWAPFVLIGDWI